MLKPKSRILISNTLFYHTTQRGIARYFEKVVDAIVEAFGDDALICSSEACHHPTIRCVRTPRFRGSRRLGLHDIAASVIAYRERASIFYSPYFGAARTSAAEVFTVYDMIHERFPEYFPTDVPQNRSFIAEKKRCIERASILLTISANTAQDILTCYPSIDPAKIVVTHLGVDPLFFAAAGQRPAMDQKPYFLFVGNRNKYKNFSRLLSAFGQSGLSKEFDLRVISPTSTGFSPPEQAIIEQYRLQGAVRLVNAASEDTLRASYAHAVALLYPSEYEGFGLPVIEAMACGTLVATSCVSSLPEVGGDVALYFDPGNVQSMIECLSQIAHLSQDQRRDRISNGVARARMFTWERCQQQTVDAFRRLM